MFQRCPRNICTLLILLLLCGPYALVQAESININGLDFEIDELSAVDGQSVKVVLFSESRIIAKDELHDYIFDKYYEAEGKLESFSFSGLASFVANSLRAKKIDQAAKGLSVIFQHKKATSDKLMDLIESLLDSASAMRLIKKALPLFVERLVAYKDPLFAMIVFVGIEDVHWLRRNIIKIAYRERRSLEKYLEKDFITKVKNKNYKQAAKLIGILEGLYGSDNSLYKKLKLWNQRLEKAQRIIKSRKVERLFPLIALMRKEADFAEVFRPLAVEALHIAAREKIAKNDPNMALTILSRIDINHRTITTHELLKNALLMLGPSNKPIIDDYQVSLFLRNLSANDQSIKEIYVSYLEKQIQLMLRSGQFSRVDHYMSKLVRVRQDPDEKNDALRVKIALALTESGRRDAAHSALDGVSSGMSFRDRLAFAFAGYYVQGRILLIIILLISLICIVLYMMKTAAILRKTKSSAEIFDDEDDEEEDEPKGFSFVLRKMGLNPGVHEYARLLRKFDLGPEADLKMIKVAYRAAIKEVHPDLTQDSIQKREDSEKFIKFTSAYERILELRKQLGLGA